MTNPNTDKRNFTIKVPIDIHASNAVAIELQVRISHLEKIVEEADRMGDVIERMLSIWESNQTDHGYRRLCSEALKAYRDAKGIE